MKLFVIIPALMMLTAGAAAWAEADEGSEATVASPSYDPTKEDCKCLGPKKVERPLDSEANDTRVVEWISDPTKGGEAPSYTAK